MGVRVERVADFAALGRRWRDLERRAACSFFQSWTWVGCLAAERYPDPVLVEAVEGGRTVALALFNRRRDRFGLSSLYLHESGSAALDSPYVEQNGVLSEAGRDAELTALCLNAVVRRYRVVLSGIGDATLGAARRVAGVVTVRRRQTAPFADLAAIRRAGGDILAGCSANTRQQIRRSDRHHSQSGPIRVHRAGTVEAGLATLDRLAALHQAAWQGRGHPGCFADPFFQRFHAALIAEGLPRGEIAVLEIAAGDATLGVLYSFVWKARMLAYQSGFAYQPGIPQARPGLSCHHAAMRHALESGLDVYDFLAGEDRYKRSLSDGGLPLTWAEAGPVFRPDLVLGWLKHLNRRRSGLVRTEGLPAA